MDSGNFETNCPPKICKSNIIVTTSNSVFRTCKIGEIVNCWNLVAVFKFSAAHGDVTTYCQKSNSTSRHFVLCWRGYLRSFIKRLNVHLQTSSHFTFLVNIHQPNLRFCEAVERTKINRRLSTVCVERRFIFIPGRSTHTHTQRAVVINSWPECVSDGVSRF